MYVCMYVCLSVCMHACMYVCIVWLGVRNWCALKSSNIKHVPCFNHIKGRRSSKSCFFLKQWLPKDSLPMRSSSSSLDWHPKAGIPSKKPLHCPHQLSAHFHVRPPPSAQGTNQSPVPSYTAMPIHLELWHWTPAAKFMLPMILSADSNSCTTTKFMHTSTCRLHLQITSSLHASKQNAAWLCRLKHSAVLALTHSVSDKAKTLSKSPKIPVTIPSTCVMPLSHVVTCRQQRSSSCQNM